MRLFSLETDAAAAELVADRCWQAGAAGIWEVELRPGLLSLRVGVDEDDARAFLMALADLGPTDVSDSAAVSLATRTVRVGPAGSEIVLTVPPAVFGDGGHPTTVACLDHLAEVLRRGNRLLDVGCGSGALSVLGARLGAEVTAIDVDAAAVEATVANARVNGVTVAASTTPLGHLPGVHDVVVANLSAGTLVQLADELRAHTAEGGTLIVSGILEDRWPEVRDAIGGAVQTAETVDGWLTAVIRP